MSLALKLVLSPLLVAQAVATRRRALVLLEATGPRQGRLGKGGDPIRVLIAGDSSAAGVGVAHQEQALAGHLSRALFRSSHRPVHWSLHARSGLTTQQVCWAKDTPHTCCSHRCRRCTASRCCRSR